MNNSIYSFPHFYEIAFSYRDLAAEVDLMEQAIQNFSRIKVKRVLEVASGNSPHLPELVRRGYSYSGLDLSPTMLDYAREKAKSLSCPANFLMADLVDFEIEPPQDFLYCMLGSLYVQNTEGLLSHFASVEKALRPGGLYFLDWCIDFAPLDNTQDSWVMRKDGYTITVNYSTRPHNPAAQLYQENITFLIKEKRTQRRLVHSGLRRALFPQEFILAATKLHRFELLGWWNDWNWRKPLEKEKGEIVRPIAILRRLST